MEELLMCSVCIERYHETSRHPVLLPRCGHSFCRSCVSMLLNAGCIVCPTCRTDQRIDYAERLPTEYTLLAIISAQENNKKETCEIHSVKLSFWCRTCEKATCGECLFEDHPTHSHEVIRAAKYIEDMKQNAQDVAVKFLEALDEREQMYYKFIFDCAKRISFAIRNIAVLRKDMEEARELMKGIKEDESITAATALSEAAKFLGLKWNIQDANFNRNKKEEKIKDDIQIEKERAQEEDARKQKELKEEEDKKKKSKEKESKKKLRKSKTLSTMEMMKEVHKMNNETNNNEEKSSLEMNEANENSKQTETKSESAKEKQEENTANEINKDIDAKPEESVGTDEKINTNMTLEDTTKDTIIDTKLKPEEETKVSEIEIKPKIEEKVKEILIRDELTIQDIIKRKEQLKKPDPIIHNDDNKVNRMDKLPDLTLTKPRPRIPRIKPIIKKITPPTTPAEEKTQKETLEPISEKDSDNTKGEKEKVENEKLEVTNNEKVETKDKTESKDSTDKESLKNEESESEDEEDAEKSKDAEEKVTVATSTQTDTEETKMKDSLEKFEVDGKFSDFIQVPGFMICVEASDGKLSSIEWGPQGLHIHCLQFTHVTYDIVIRDTILNSLIPSKSPIVFLELTADHTILGRVYIQMWGHLRRAHNFISLCLGDQGKSFLNTKFLQVYNVDGPGERMLGGDYEYNNGRGGRGLLDDLEWNGDYAMPMEAGMITAAGSGQTATNSLFLICSKSDPSRNFSCPFGIVCEGLKVIKDAVQETATKQVWITDCGVLIQPPNMEQEDIS